MPSQASLTGLIFFPPHPHIPDWLLLKIPRCNAQNGNLVPE